MAGRTNKKEDQRRSPLRRQINEAFCSPNGSFSPSKFLAVWAQIAILAHMNIWFDKLLDKPESMLIILSFLVAPDIVKKLIVMKLGGVK